MNQTGITGNIPRVVIAGIHSNCGKTTVARGLMAAFMKRGLRVQPYKVGPDFIDPSHHTHICGRVSRNLDPVMMGESNIREIFLRSSQDADIAIIEGVMGMYDGIDGTLEGSTAHIARLLDAPILLVIPVKGMSGSVHAIAEGFAHYSQGTRMGGVILNMVGSPRHKELLKVGKKIPQLGFIPMTHDLEIGSRHLGLHMGEETNTPRDLAEIIEAHCDIEAILTLARETSQLNSTPYIPSEPGIRTRIAIARDPAFCFYYQDNLESLRRKGAELIFFSPMTDDLPDVDLLYLGGGYPELYAKELEAANARMQIRDAAEKEMPIYAECGGLMYLGSGIEGNGNISSARWTDILPVEACMEKRFQALGYTIGYSQGGQETIPAGTEIRGHEFHYSRLYAEHDARYAITLTRGKGIEDAHDGIYSHNSIGCYTHAWFSDQMTEGLIQAAQRYRLHKEKK